MSIPTVVNSLLTKHKSKSSTNLEFFVRTFIATKLSITSIARTQRAHRGIRRFGCQSPWPFGVLLLMAMIDGTGRL